MKTEEIGITEGDICNRLGCCGVIATHPPENCSCHINPPCGACTGPSNFCPVCEWQEKDDEVWSMMNAMVRNSDAARAMTNPELCEALRRTIGDNLPMNEPSYDLLEEAAERLEKMP